MESRFIINRVLYTPQPHEHVCIACGRVARLHAKYCQCGESLTKLCGICKSEIAVDYTICDQCGCAAVEISDI